MKLLLGLTTAIVLLATAVTAQTSAPKPMNHPNAELIDTIPTDVVIYAKNSTKGVRGAFVVAVWRTSPSTVELSLDAAGVAFSEDVEVADEYSASEIFDVLCAQSVNAALSDGHLWVPSSGTGYSAVTLASCVDRTAYGYSVVGTDVNRRSYQFAAGPTIGVTGVSGVTACGSGTEGTWEAATFW